MTAKFWDTIGSQLAERWFAVATPAIIFWTAAVAAWALSAGGQSALSARIDEFALQSFGAQIVVVVGALIGVTASALFVDRLTLPVTRLLEGYWPAPFGPLKRRAIESRAGGIRRDDEAWQALAGKVAGGTATRDERSRYVELEIRLRRVPRSDSRMPTRLGDTVRAAETLPDVKYGLDAVKCWPSFWLVLPETARKELAGARASLDEAIVACVWAVLAIGFAVWWPWALIVAPLLARAIYVYWVCPRAEVFADLVESAFDVHRSALYAALRWPLPATPAEELTAGASVTDYLWRGSNSTQPTFTEPAS